MSPAQTHTTESLCEFCPYEVERIHAISGEVDMREQWNTVFVSLAFFRDPLNGQEWHVKVGSKEESSH